ncbi:class I SAM-dependent RNA methyltransferase, partial [Agromyces sp. CCNWLW208]
RPVVAELVGARRFAVDRDGFWQVHRGAAATLTRAVQELVDPDRFDAAAEHHDLYGGVGLLAAAIGDRFGPSVRITTVEADARATLHAGENLAEWVGARAVTARVDRYLDELAGVSDGARPALRGATVVLDPPRSGAGRDVVERIAALAPAQVVYVACDPVALARDVGLFRERGFELEAVRAYDLFPNTHHVEAVARLGAARV